MRDPELDEGAALPAHAGVPTFAHEALVYVSLEQFVATTVPFVLEGLEAGEPVLIATKQPNLRALREALGPRSRQVTLADTDTWHPATMKRLRAFHELTTEHAAAGGGRTRLGGEPIWSVDRPGLVREWQRYESALNAALAATPATLLCFYDAAILDIAITEAAERTHPAKRLPTGVVASDRFVEPREFLAATRPELAPVTADRSVAVAGMAQLSPLRRWAGGEAVRCGVPTLRVWDLQAALHEVAANALRHAGGSAIVRSWVSAGTFTLEVADDGPGIADDLTGYLPPPPDVHSGRGLWLARQLCDLLEIATSAGGTTVRLHTFLR